MHDYTDQNKSQQDIPIRRKEPSNEFIIVSIAASAGGLAAFEKLLTSTGQFGPGLGRYPAGIKSRPRSSCRVRILTLVKTSSKNMGMVLERKSQ
jgi:hypothetical protein